LAGSIFPAQKTFIFLLLSSLFFSACSQMQQPDFAALYQTERIRTQQPPVILIHGIMGSKLRSRKTGEEVWPGSFWQVLFGDYQNLANRLSADMDQVADERYEAFAIADQIAGTDFYGSIIRTLVDFGGYELRQAGQPQSSEARRPGLYLLLYDWRQDNVQSVSQLDALIEKIRKDHDDPKLRVDIIAHSMGGLIARYYARYGTRDVLNSNEFPVSHKGSDKLRRVVLLGTPNFGSLSSLHSLVRGQKVGLQRVSPTVLATMPSIFQLLPHAINTWLVTVDGEPLSRDIFDVRIWRRFQWSVFDPKIQKEVLNLFSSKESGEQYLARLELFFERSLERARRFLWSLSVEIEDAEQRYIVFGGTCEPTPARALVEEVNGESVLRLWPSEIRKQDGTIDYEELILEPGDGLVTKASLLARTVLDPSTPRHKYSFFSLESSFFLCEDHEHLTGNKHFQDNLLHALLHAKQG